MTQQVDLPFAPLRMPIRKLLFDTRGRIPRSTWWLATAGNLGTLFLSITIISNANEASPGPHLVLDFLGVVAMMLAIVVGIAVSAKRWHDMDHSAWFILWALVPYLGGLTIVWYGFVRGTKGENQYGLDPLLPDLSVEAQQGAQADGPTSGGSAA